MNKENLKTALQKIIVEEVWIDFDENTKSIVLQELDNIDKKKKTLKTVKVKGITEYYLAFKLDDPRHTFLSETNTLIAKIGDIRKAVDAVLLCRVDKFNYIFLFEMKTKRVESIPEKIKSSRAFLAFLQSILKSYEAIDISTFKMINVVFHTKVSKGKPDKVYKKGVEYLRYGFNVNQGNSKNEISIRHFL